MPSRDVGYFVGAGVVGCRHAARSFWGREWCDAVTQASVFCVSAGMVMTTAARGLTKIFRGIVKK